MIERPARLWVPEAPYLITNPTIEVGEIPMGFGIEGYFTVELIHARTGDVVRKLEFRNLITDAGIRAIAAGTAIDTLFNYLAVGTGTKEPEVTDTALHAELGRTNNTGGVAYYTVWPSDYSYIAGRRTRVFTESQANGVLSEVGFFSSAGGGTMLVRQLLRDQFGLPTTITKNPDQQLRVTHEVRIYGDQVGTDSELIVMGVPTAVRTRAYSIRGGLLDWSWTRLPARLGVINVTINFCHQMWENQNMPPDVFALQTGAKRAWFDTDGWQGSSAVEPYVAGTTYRDYYFTYEASKTNFPTGIGSITTLTDGGSDNVGMETMIATFNPKIPKTDKRKAATYFRAHYGRYTP